MREWNTRLVGMQPAKVKELTRFTIHDKMNNRRAVLWMTSSAYRSFSKSLNVEHRHYVLSIQNGNISVAEGSDKYSSYWTCLLATHGINNGGQRPGEAVLWTHVPNSARFCTTRPSLSLDAVSYTWNLLHVCLTRKRMLCLHASRIPASAQYVTDSMKTREIRAGFAVVRHK